MSKSCATNLTSWMKNSDKSGCKECSLAILTNWYRSELGDDVMNNIGLENMQPDEVAEKLDAIKGEFPEKKDELRELDCYAQEGNELIK